MMKSRAAVMQAPGRVNVREFDVPAADKSAVVIKVSLSGICGTDKHTFRGEYKQYAGTAHEPGIEYPLICGNENVGIMVDVGSEVRSSDGELLRRGDRMVPVANVPCKNCYYCMNSSPYYFCERLEDYGNSLNCIAAPHLMGGWPEYRYLLSGTPFFRVPEQLLDEAAVITEVMAVIHGLETAFAILGPQGDPPVGRTVVVLGVGPLELCHMVKARLTGAGRIIATDKFPSRLELAGELGADDVLNVTTTSVEERAAAVASMTGGRGVDIVIECNCVPATFVQSLRMVRTGGVGIEAGTIIGMGPVLINLNSDSCTRNVSVEGVDGKTAGSHASSMALMAANLDQFPLGRIVTHQYGLDEAQQEVIAAQSDEAMQVVINPNLATSARGTLV